MPKCTGAWRLKEVTKAAGRTRIFPLSYGQKRLLWLHRLGEIGPAYHVMLGLRFAHGVVPAALVKSLDGLARRHEVLRARYVWSASGDAHQVVTDDFQIPLSWRTRQATSGWRSAVSPEALEPFDLAAAPPVRAVVARCTDGSDVLLIVMHHIMVDGQTLRILARDFTAI